MSTLRVNTIQDQPGTGLPSAGQVGVGQTWQNVTGSRTSGTTYTNSTGKPIQVAITIGVPTGAGNVLTVSVGGVSICDLQSGAAISLRSSFSFIVPNGATYVCTSSFGIAVWSELR